MAPITITPSITARRQDPRQQWDGRNLGPLPTERDYLEEVWDVIRESSSKFSLE